MMEINHLTGLFNARKKACMIGKSEAKSIWACEGRGHPQIGSEAGSFYIGHSILYHRFCLLPR